MKRLAAWWKEASYKERQAYACFAGTTVNVYSSFSQLPKIKRHILYAYLHGRDDMEKELNTKSQVLMDKLGI